MITNGIQGDDHTSILMIVAISDDWGHRVPLMNSQRFFSEVWGQAFWVIFEPYFHPYFPFYSEKSWNCSSNAATFCNQTQENHHFPCLSLGFWVSFTTIFEPYLSLMRSPPVTCCATAAPRKKQPDRPHPLEPKNSPATAGGTFAISMTEWSFFNALKYERHHRTNKHGFSSNPGLIVRGFPPHHLPPLSHPQRKTLVFGIRSSHVRAQSWNNMSYQ